MTTPAKVPGVPSDKLIAPMNAPSGGATQAFIQPGVSTAVVFGQYVVVFGTTGGLFIYAGTPAPGNAPIYTLANADTDPYGNAIDPGFVAGAPGTNQVVIQTQSGVAEIFFPSSNSPSAEPQIVAVNVAGGVEFNIFSAQDTETPLATSDRVALAFYDNLAGSGSARWALGYYDTSGTFHFQAAGDFTGVQLLAQNVAAVLPGTGTSPSNPATAESWHTGTLASGWAASTGVAGLYYRLLPFGAVEVIADIINTTATGNSTCFTLPTGYRPSVDMNFPAGWNNPAASNSASPPWISVQGSGIIQVTGIEVANKEIFFHLIIPLGSL